LLSPYFSGMDMTIEDVRKMLTLAHDVKNLLDDIESTLNRFEELLKGYIICVYSDVTMMCRRGERCIIMVIDPVEKKALKAVDIGAEDMRMWSIDRGVFENPSKTDVEEFENMYASTINKCATAVEEEIKKLESATNTLKAIYTAISVTRTD